MNQAQYERMQGRAIGHGRNRLLEIRQRLSVPAPVSDSTPEMEIRPRVGRIVSQSVPVVPRCLGLPAQCLECGSQIAVGIRVKRIDLGFILRQGKPWQGGCR